MEPSEEAKEAAAFFYELLALDVPPEAAAQMAMMRVHAERMAKVLAEPKDLREPWQND